MRELDRVHSAGLDAYRSDALLRAATERRLQTALQVCIDLGAQLLAERALATPATYREVFVALESAGILADGLGRRLGVAAGQRNLLVHDYLDVDDAKVFAALEHLDDLRAFAAVVAGSL